jgi:hypothetical protein
MIYLKNSKLKFRFNRTVTRLGLYIAACIAAQAPSLCADKPENGYEIEQKSIMVGKVFVRAYPKAFQFTENATGIIFVARAPDWTLQIINPIAKTYHECKIAAFVGTMNRGVALFTGRTISDVNYDPKPTKEADGLLRYTSGAEYTKREEEYSKNQTNGRGLPKEINIWIDPKIVLPPQVAAFASRLYGISQPKGMPLKALAYDFDRNKKVYLTTTKSTTRQLTDSDFQKRMPSFKRVANVEEVYRNEATDDAMGEMIESLNGTFGKKKL